MRIYIYIYIIHGIYVYTYIYIYIYIHIEYKTTIDSNTKQNKVIPPDVVEAFARMLNTEELDETSNNIDKQPTNNNQQNIKANKQHTNTHNKPNIHK